MKVHHLLSKGAVPPLSLITAETGPGIVLQRRWTRLHALGRRGDKEAKMAAIPQSPRPRKFIAEVKSDPSAYHSPERGKTLVCAEPEAPACADISTARHSVLKPKCSGWRPDVSDSDRGEQGAREWQGASSGMKCEMSAYFFPNMLTFCRLGKIQMMLLLPPARSIGVSLWLIPSHLDLNSGFGK